MRVKQQTAPRSVEARLLGRFEIRVDGSDVDLQSRAAQSLLAYLMLSAGVRHRREKLACMFWPDADDTNGRSYLRHALWRMRKALGDVKWLSSDDITVAFDPPASYWLDVAVFEHQSGDTSEDALMQSAGAYQGHLLPGFYDEWAALERERLEALVPDRFGRLIELLAGEKRWGEVTEWAERWVALGGAPEEGYRALMRAYAATGDRSRMLAAYQRCVRALERELDTSPSEQTQELLRELSADARQVDARIPPRVPTISPMTPPFKGLRHFEDADAGIFCGREPIVARLAERLRKTTFLALIGASGTGKSSILRAGLLPLLRRGAPDLALFLVTPGERPLASLARGLARRLGEVSADTLVAALSADAHGLARHLLSLRSKSVLVVDQFEEIFTVCRDPFEREAFIDNLIAAAESGSTSCVVALRADFYGHCADYPSLRDAVSRAQEYLGPMSRADLRRAIEVPAAVGGCTLEPGLTDVLLHDVGDEPGALPLLSHALLETWERRDRTVLTLEGYSRSGGVRGAIARTAESVFERFASDEQTVAKDIFLRLVELGDGTQDTRRRTSLHELTAAQPALASRVLRTLTEARLVTVGEDTVDVAHEALIREWPRLREWLAEDRDALTTHREITRAALEWVRLGRDPGALYRGVRLGRALELTAERPTTLNAGERTFLDASRQLSDREARERDDTVRRLRRRAMYLAIALLFLVGSVTAAAFFAERARASSDLAVAEQQRAMIEMARNAGATVGGRLDRIRSSLASQQLLATLSEEAALARADPSRGDVGLLLTTLQRAAGPDAGVLIMTEYRRARLVAISANADAESLRVRAAQAALAGTAPRSTVECPFFWNQYAVSSPYMVAPGEPPFVAIAHYAPPCGDSYALVLDMSLRDAGEWIRPILAATDDAYLVDATGRLAARSRRAPDLLADLAGAELVQAALRTHEAFVVEGRDPVSGVPILAAVAPVADIGWRVIVLRPLLVAQRNAGPEPLQLVGAAAVVIAMLGGTAAATYVSLRSRRSRRTASYLTSNGPTVA